MSADVKHEYTSDHGVEPDTCITQNLATANQYTADQGIEPDTSTAEHQRCELFGDAEPERTEDLVVLKPTRVYRMVRLFMHDCVFLVLCVYVCLF